MGYVHARISISNPGTPDLKPVGVNASVNMGALMLCIPEQLQHQLDLKEEDKREVTTAGGARHLIPYVGPVNIKFENRSCFVGALVIGDEVLLGAVPMEDVDRVIHPATKPVTVNPASPNFPHTLVK